MLTKPKMEQSSMISFFKLTAKFASQLEINLKIKLFIVIHAVQAFIKAAMVLKLLKRTSKLFVMLAKREIITRILILLPVKFAKEESSLLKTLMGTFIMYLV